MKALTLWQPWASLVALGHKRVETRGWAPRHRGPLAIHAAAGWNDAMGEGLAAARLVLHGAGLAQLPRALPRGAIVAVARLAGCVQSRGPDGWPPLEQAFGDLAAGRWAWRLADVRALDRPVPCKGAQGLWTVPGELLPLLGNDGDRPGQPSLFSGPEDRR